MAFEDRCSERETRSWKEGGYCLEVGSQAVASKRVENTEEPIVSSSSLELQLTATAAEL